MVNLADAFMINTVTDGAMNLLRQIVSSNFGFVGMFFYDTRVHYGCQYHFVSYYRVFSRLNKLLYHPFNKSWLKCRCGS